MNTLSSFKERRALEKRISAKAKKNLNAFRDSMEAQLERARVAASKVCVKSTIYRHSESIYAAASVGQTDTARAETNAARKTSMEKAGKQKQRKKFADDVDRDRSIRNQMSKVTLAVQSVVDAVLTVANRNVMMDFITVTFASSVPNEARLVFAENMRKKMFGQQKVLGVWVWGVHGGATDMVESEYSHPDEPFLDLNGSAPNKEADLRPHLHYFMALNKHQRRFFFKMCETWNQHYGESVGTVYAHERKVRYNDRKALDMYRIGNYMSQNMLELTTEQLEATAMAKGLDGYAAKRFIGQMMRRDGDIELWSNKLGHRTKHNPRFRVASISREAGKLLKAQSTKDEFAIKHNGLSAGLQFVLRVARKCKINVEDCDIDIFANGAKIALTHNKDTKRAARRSRKDRNITLPMCCAYTLYKAGLYEPSAEFLKFIKIPSIRRELDERYEHLAVNRRSRE